MLHIKPKILVSESDGFSPTALKLLSQRAAVTLTNLDRTGLLAAAGETEILWVRLRNRIDREIMAAAPSLKVIVTATTGLDHIDMTEATRRGIRVLSLNGEREFLYNVRATAEHTMSLMLALLRHIPAAVLHVQNRGWNRDLFKGSELYNKTVGVVGYGRLGQLVTRYLTAFDARVIVSDPTIEFISGTPELMVMPLSNLLKEADLVTLHVNLCEDTRGFFGKQQFEAMQNGAWFINTSRGELVDEDGLLEGLRSKRLSGAAIDVLANEQSNAMEDHPLVVYAREHENLIITPHVGGCTSESMERTELFIAQKLFAYLEGITDRFADVGERPFL